MLRRRRVFAVEPLWSRAGAQKPWESCMALTSTGVYRKLQEAAGGLTDPPSPEPQQGSGVSSALGVWSQAESPTEPVLPGGLFPKSGRLLKSESEDSGVEMAGNENSLSTPLGSETSFSLDGLDSCQQSAAGSAAGDPAESSEAEQPGEPDLVQEQAYFRSLSVSKKLAQVMQRSQKLHTPGRSLKPLGRNSMHPAELELLASCGLPGLGDQDRAAEGQDQAGCQSLEAQSPEEAEVRQEPCFALPGQGLRYLEHVCLMLEAIAQLQQANWQLQQQQKALASQLWGQPGESAVPAEDKQSSALEEREPVQPNLVPASTKEVEMQEEDFPLPAWRPHHFRARSASDAGILQDLTRSPENEPANSRKTAVHCVSSPTLLDQPDWGAQTLPPSRRSRNDRSHWGKVKVLINRITRKSLRAHELPPRRESAVESRYCSLEASLEKQGAHPRRSFLPALGVKRHRSKPLSVR